MTKLRHREETINTQLAILISKLGVKAEAESIHVRGKERPDVMFDLRGLRVVIEGKFADHPNANTSVLNDARGRVQRGIAHIAVAVVYPEDLRTVSTSDLIECLQNTKMNFSIASETGNTEWFEGTPSGLMDALRRIQEAMSQDDIVEQTAKSLSDRLEGIAQLWIGQKGTCDRLSNILGMFPPKGELSTKADERRKTAAKVSALVIANALIFQEQLAISNREILPLHKIEKEKDVINKALSHWRWIWNNINYVPIFQIGESILEELPSSQNTTSAFLSLLAEAKDICVRQSALRHDLMGRIYHWLLHHAKYLGTYYTAVSSATLLLKLALSKSWERDFGDPDTLSSFKVADLTCGTGTLLMATAQAISDAYICARVESGRSLDKRDLDVLHKVIMEDMVYGYDVLPSAVHLTASTLALLAPEVAFVGMNLFVMPMGMDGATPRLGSLDFLDHDTLQTQMSLDYSLQVEAVLTSARKTESSNAILPKIDLFVMNPPFVRSVGGNLLFGSLPDERGAMQKELKRRLKTLPGASATAGLGSVFVALANNRLADKGRLAFVLPAALVSGEAWGETRKLLANQYHLETVVASHDADRPNFSENTDLSEVLFIARKRTTGEARDYTTYINLLRNPRSIYESLDLASRLLSQTPVSVSDEGITSIHASSGKLAEMVSTPEPRDDENWTGALFAQTDLLRIFWELNNGQVKIPGIKKLGTIPLCKLSEIGDLGYDRRDIHDAFTVSTEDWSPYSAFWNHDAKLVTSILQFPNARLIKRTVAASGRPLKNAEQVWGKSGTILLVESLRSNTHRVLGIGFNERVLGNTWWALMCKDLTKSQEKALLLWLNSSLSLLLFFGRRVITQGAWMQMKKPAWMSMPLINVRKLPNKQVDMLSSAYDQLANKELKALANLNIDPIRAAIDDAISASFDLPDLRNISELLAREPGLTGKPIKNLNN